VPGRERAAREERRSDSGAAMVGEHVCPAMLPRASKSSGLDAIVGTGRSGGDGSARRFAFTA
jgi:hypothetical protein